MVYTTPSNSTCDTPKRLSSSIFQKVNVLLLTHPVVNKIDVQRVRYHFSRALIIIFDCDLITKIWTESMYEEHHLWTLPIYCKISNISRIKSDNLVIVVSSCSCLWPIHWSQLLSWEWRCNWSSADRRCSNYIWVMKKCIANSCVSYIRGLTIVMIYYSIPLLWTIFIRTLEWAQKHLAARHFLITLIDQTMSLGVTRKTLSFKQIRL